MARSILGHKDEYRDSGKNHPVDTSFLLALIRGQHLENEAFVRQHLASCERCQEDFAWLSQTSMTLDVLDQVAHYQRYPELSTSQLMKNARMGYAQRRFSGRRAARYAYNGRRSAVRLAVPFMMLVVLMVITLIALALGFGKASDRSNIPGGGIHQNSNQLLSTGVAQHMPSPSPNPTQMVTPSPTDRTARTIKDCTTTKDADRHFLDICGRNFKPGDRVVLYVTFSKQPVSFGSAQVNSSGMFTVRLYIPSCRDGQMAIYAKDVTSKKPLYSNTLPRVAAPGCATQTPNPWQTTS